MRELDDDRPHRKHCVCATCKADRDARYALLEAEARVPVPAPAAPAPVAPPPPPRPEPVLVAVAAPAPVPVSEPGRSTVPSTVRHREWYGRLMADAAEARPSLRKEDARCCTSRRDTQGRLPIGYGSPECERRPR